MSELSKLTRDLGGIEVLKHDIHDEMGLVDLIQRGLPVQSADEVVIWRVITADEVRDMIVPTRTLARRRKEGRLDSDESDKLVRIARIVELARETMGEEKAALWMRRPNRALKSKVPLELCRTEAGARLVEAVLGRISYGGIS